MLRKICSGAAICALFISLTTLGFAQDSTVKGTLAGVVTDPTGAVVPGAAATLSGPTGTNRVDTDGSGRFSFLALTPGMYSVKIEKTGFKTAEVKAVEVLTGKTAQLTLKLETGITTTTVEVNAEATTVDTSSNAVSANLTDAFYAAVPIQRNVASLFYTAPGVVSGGQTGAANPSIGGASGLENQYIADGVNITNSAYGGLGVYTQNQGAVGSGINLSFIKEVDVKTSSYEPQYGQSTGGIVQIITKSGGDQFHGALSGYFAPSGMRATEKFRDNVSVQQRGKRTGLSEYEVSAELGGYIPGLKNHLFFFGSIDPTRTTDTYAVPPVAGLFATNPVIPQHYQTINYDGKLTFKINDKHTFEASIFGDPSKTNTTSLTDGTPPNFNLAGATGFSNWKYGTRNIVGRYNGTLSPTWLVDFSGSYNTNYFHEKPASDVFQITDRTNVNNAFIQQGFGRLEQHNAHQSGWTADTSKVVHGLGTHTLSVGVHYEQPEYTNISSRSGGTYAIPALNYQGNAYLPTGTSVPIAGAPSDGQFSINPIPLGAVCTICPTDAAGQVVYAKQTRGQFGGSGAIRTHGRYEDAYVNDSWTINKHVTASLGWRWEEQKAYGTLTKYTFVDNWSPRIGVTVDPMGDRKSKIFANFARYSYDLPLDAAIRSLSGENDFFTAFAPVLTGGLYSIVPDQAHTIAGTDPAFGASVALAGLQENFIHGTKMSYENEFVVGAEHEWKGIVFSARYVDRRLQRIIEDASGISPEGSFGGSGEAQNYSIVNPSPTLDAFVNETQVVIPAGTTLAGLAAFPGCSGIPATQNIVGFANGVAGPSFDNNGNQFSPNSICFLNNPTSGLVGGSYGADGRPDGFAQPVRNYTALEFEVNKSFSNNYLMRINYRHAKLYGNYEGAFRNDNGQSDPGISSLFDFVPGQYNLLGNQFALGYLNTDARNVVNTFFSYTVPTSHAKGLTLGTSIRVSSGQPLNNLGNHPSYGNQGEVPLGGRGSLGRTPVAGNVDFKLDYPVKMGERYTLRLGASLFNVLNYRPALLVDQFNAKNFSPVGSNPDFLKAITYQDPFQARLTARIEF